MIVRVGTPEQIAMVDKVVDMLGDAHPVQRQVVIEILMAMHAARMPGSEIFVIDAMAKHAKQIMSSLGDAASKQ